MRMVLPKCINTYITEADNIYDLVGNCYGLLCEMVPNQADFIAVYLSKNIGGVCNPNLDELSRFFEEVMYAVQMYQPTEYVDFIAKVRKQIQKLDLKRYEDAKLNKLTVIFFLLAGIDAGARSWNPKKLFSRLGPLDRLNKTGYRVYFNERQTLHSEYVDNVGREMQHASDFSAQFETFRFIHTKEWQMGNDIPQVLLITCNHAVRYGGKKKLRIAVIPGLNQKNFEFENAKGSSLVVDYTSIIQENIESNVMRSLEKAVKTGCDIIVLPEYVTSPGVYEVIRSQIKKMCRQIPSDKRPWLIFCGTSWTEDNNNVMRILDAWGDEIGQYYKYSPFTKKRRGKYGYEMYEALSDPGKYCDLIAVEGIGTFLPAICRDVIDGKCTEEIVRLLHPFCVVISAWSPSVKSFKVRQEELANKFFANSIFVNACSAVGKRRVEIGNAGIVHKRGTVAGIRFEPIRRDKCSTNCKYSTCVYIAEYDFEYLNNGNTKISISKL